MTTEHTLRTQRMSLAYDDRTVVHDLDLQVPPGLISVVVGANACGKSTLLRGLARLAKPTTGAVLLDGRSIHETADPRGGPHARAAAAVAGRARGHHASTDLVGRGRYPHQGWLRRWTSEDDEAWLGR